MRRHTETNKKRNTDSRYTYTRWTHSTLIFPNICHFPFIRSRSNQTNQHLFDSIRVPFEYSRCFSPLAAIWRRRTLVARLVGRRQLKSLPKKRYKGLFPPQWVWFLELEHVAGCLLSGGVVEWYRGEVLGSHSLSQLYFRPSSMVP